MSEKERDYILAARGLGNFNPAILDYYTLWNVEELYWRAKDSRGQS